ncbi:MAG: OadG family protein [candidate division KSB1 bacterium]|jgi:Na+-transporting methylmalonyl-CoA/oxaloacetate decarboxylase gamma subunit|nr:OadG family protein [candidate division KSB1 bacterium]
MEQGIKIAILGVSIVFASLATMYLCMLLFVRLLEYTKSRKLMPETKRPGDDQRITGEVVTAIALALQLSREEFHDMEETIITMQRITRPYSPWSSKIHGIRKPAR